VRDEEQTGQEIATLRAALEREQGVAQAERRRALRWEREAVFRASTVAGTLAMRVMAAQRLAEAVERLTTTDDDTFAAAEVRDALRFFREVDPGFHLS
jgi:hypothetical protein